MIRREVVPSSGEHDGIREVHVSKHILLEAERHVRGHGAEKLFELSGEVRGTTARVNALHPITDGVSSERNSVQVTDIAAANRQFSRLRSGRTDDQIGAAHSHLPEHLQGPSPQDMESMSRHTGEAHRQVYFLFQDRGNGTMGFQARNTYGERIRVAVHDEDTGQTYLDAPDSAPWRLESDGSFAERVAA